MLNTLISNIREQSKEMTDNRKASLNKQYGIEDIVMGVFSVFFLQSPSFLAYQERMRRKHSTHNGETLFGFKQIPSDNQIRNMLDDVEHKECDKIFVELHRKILSEHKK